MGAAPLRFGYLADFPPLATPLPEPARLSLFFLPPDTFLLETFSTIRLASFFGFAAAGALTTSRTTERSRALAY